MHFDTNHGATYTLECLLLKISMKSTFEPFLKIQAIFSGNKTFCRCRTGQIGAMSGKMRMIPPMSEWVCTHSNIFDALLITSYLPSSHYGYFSDWDK